MTTSFGGAEFRRILGHYPTGVCAITAIVDGQPVAMVVGSFTSVSLDPPLVAFLPDRKSTSWPKIEAAGRFCVNVLAEHQEDVCRVLASKAENKFETVPYRLSDAGLPIVNGVVAWIDCDLYAVHEAGDHFIAIGQVHSLDIEHPHRPLLFFQGGYGQFAPFEKPL
ncbi:MAG: flavin reductase domain protein FMN-binding protein [Sphingomonas bacterium]|jgi:3-hydroxy-9,10-secoandrosta-1,3,5(10)-triene-9,17-dione monooxygenase reductase component|nr:flavin reductase domain protein FMN-binding protein [Sphingomonas bacterium]